MPEYVRSVKIVAEVDTNKQTYRFVGTTLAALKVWIANLYAEIEGASDE